MSRPVVLFLGYGSEYSLHPLCEFMTKAGDQCVEIDMLTEPDVVERLRALSGQPLIFVTSAHPLYDQRNFLYYKTNRRVISALHVISTLRPKLSVYYPHDYKDPIKDEELAYMPLFDLMLWPLSDAPAKLRRLVKTVPVGWIKNPAGAPPTAPGENRNRSVFFLGAYQYYLDAGFDVFCADFKPVLDSGAAVKLPRWHGNREFEQFLQDRGIEICPSEDNSIDIMKASDIVVGHALSSVIIEACHLGKKVVYILDPRFDYKDPLLEFAGAGNIAFVSSPAAVSGLDPAQLPANSCTMAQFDSAAVRDLILAEYGKR